jgi:hypothetical protein
VVSVYVRTRTPHPTLCFMFLFRSSNAQSSVNELQLWTIQYFLLWKLAGKFYSALKRDSCCDFGGKTRLKTTHGNATALSTCTGNKLLYSLAIRLDSFSRTAIKNTMRSSKWGSDDPIASPYISGGSKCFNIMSLFSATKQRLNPSISHSQ